MSLTLRVSLLSGLSFDVSAASPEELRKKIREALHVR